MDASAALAALSETEELSEHPDAAIAELEKCKHASHLRVVAIQADAHGPGDQQVRYLATMACRNDAGYSGPGALIAPRGKVTGMHLFPDACELLEAQLPIVADHARGLGAGWGVAIEHTVKKKLEPWRVMTPDAADQIALELAALGL